MKQFENLKMGRSANRKFLKPDRCGTYRKSFKSFKIIEGLDREPQTLNFKLETLN
jgi:hypothetical protein